jgi:hypothetical protein
MRRWREHRQWSSVVVLGVLLATFWLLAGVWGVVGWLAVAATWLSAPTIGAVAVGHVLIVALAPEEAGITTLLPSVAAVIGLLIVEFAGKSLGDAGVYTGLVLVTATLVVGLERIYSPLAATIVLLTVVGSGSYLLHRYVLLELDLVETPESDTQAESNTTVSRAKQ